MREMDYYYSDMAQTMDTFQSMPQWQAWGIVVLVVLLCVPIYKMLKILLPINK